MEQMTQPKTVGDVLDGMPDVSTFNQLVRRSKLISQIDGPGPFTVLAPSNAAFDRLPPNAIGEIVNRPHVLSDFIQNHVVPGLYMRDGMSVDMTLANLLGAALTVVAVEPGPYIGGARVVEGDISAENGVVHIIDSILMPQQD